MKRAVGLLMIVLVAVACSSEPAKRPEAAVPPGCQETKTGAGAPSLHIVDYEFVPKCFVTSEPTIVVTNDGSVKHNFTIDGTSIDVDIKAGRSGGITVAGAAEPGVGTSFHCKYHPSMVGEILLIQGP